MGLGFVAARDVVSFLRNDKADAAGVANPLAGAGIERAIGFGISQSGRYIRDFLYQGFDEDEAGRVVFEGLMPHIGGGKKTFVNYRFGQPGRNVQQHADHLYPGDQFPFTYPVLTDALSGKTDGLLARCLAASNCPKVIQTDTELEIYQSRASLVATDTKGDAVAMPDNVRLYLIANSPHFSPFGAKAVPNAICEQPMNPLHGGDPMRALLVAMDQWITSGAAPPASRYPSRADGTWVTPEEDADAFPSIPGFAYQGLVDRPTLIDHAAMPPKSGAAYPVFVAKRDADGHDLAGIRLPLLDAPTMTLLGFNTRKAGFAQGELCDNIGSALPLAKTREARLAAHDSRLSLEERYPRPGDYVAAVTRSVEGLVAARLLLDEDAKRMIAEAKQVE
jgi:Alpha/beta hydrolase domain